MTARATDDQLRERVAKLPAWAREYIARLERRTEDAESKHAELFDAQEPTRVTYGDHYQNPRYLPDDGYTSVRFYLTDNRWVELAPVRNPQDHYGEPDAKITCSTGMLIMPQVSNVIGVKIADN